ncbi:hypothetical protein HYE67_008810 [Fusarium culmorum]|uniref:Uncharacterized protein n=1 Tax=Fusarium culmorum TaxID=5516 RepID=A0A2T4HBF6_FUSCU|nr:hypothetical protein FCULG_00003514 [Fusarium culmorum]QPC66579.1 hypothetical protein HYE67_008810 [Fusarium culmorum]
MLQCLNDTQRGCRVGIHKPKPSQHYMWMAVVVVVVALTGMWTSFALHCPPAADRGGCLFEKKTVINQNPVNAGRESGIFPSGVSVETKGLGSFKLMHGLAILMVPACATKPPTPRFGQADLNTTAIDRFQNVRYTASAALTTTRPLNKCLSQGNEGWASVSAPEALWCSTAHAGLVIAALAGRLFPNGERDYARVGQGGS